MACIFGLPTTIMDNHVYQCYEPDDIPELIKGNRASVLATLISNFAASEDYRISRVNVLPLQNTSQSPNVKYQSNKPVEGVSPPSSDVDRSIRSSCLPSSEYQLQEVLNGER